MANHKTPVSLLQEVGAKRGITPTYELLSNQGLTHEPIYVYKCIAGEWSSQAQGASKKKAKHYVALLVLMQMVKSCKENPNEANKFFIEEVKNSASGLLGRDDAFQIISSEFLLDNSGLEVVVDQLNSRGEDSQPTESQLLSCPINEEELGNPIGQLQELCQRNMWPQASYEFSIDQRQHETHCLIKLWKWSIEAIGKSRKLAKRRAALNMLDKLKTENLTIPREVLDMMEEGTLKLEARAVDTEKSQVDDGDASQQPVEFSTESQRSQRAYSRNLRGAVYAASRPGLLLSSDMLPESTDEPQTAVDILCSRSGLTPLYTYITCSVPGVSCLLQIDTEPPHVVLGRGSSLETARATAAAALVDFLQQMHNPVVLREDNCSLQLVQILS